MSNKKALPDFTPDMLTSQIRELEAELVNRVYSQVPPRVEYSILK